MEHDEGKIDETPGMAAIFLNRALEIGSPAFSLEEDVAMQKNGDGHDVRRVISEIAVRHFHEAADGCSSGAHEDDSKSDLRRSEY
jgi:hypothetical protein